MKNAIIMLVMLAGALVLAICALSHRLQRAEEQRDAYRANTEILMSGIENLRADSALQARQVQTLALDIDEYKRLREEDARTIRTLGIRLRDVTAAAKQQITVATQISAPAADSIIIVHDTTETVKAMSFHDPHISFHAVLQDDTLAANIQVPVRLSQVLYKVPRHRFLWWSWGCKAVKQVIATDNPYVHIDYSEYIEIK